MPHRIFIAINLPKDIKTELLACQKDLKDLPVRWVKEDNLHITLIFLGHLRDEEIPDICNAVREVAQKTNPFFIHFKEICYGPPKKSPPRMIWALGKESQKLSSLNNDLEQKFLAATARKSSAFESRPFSPHITLGRLKQWEWRWIEPDERPEVKKELPLYFEARSIEVMESYLKRGGPEYAILESVPLSK